MQVDFIKGHMGGNIIVFLYGEQIPKGREVEVALEVLEPLSISGHETGILYPPQNGGNLMVKIIGFSSRRFIPMCGGLTQVLGKLLIETRLGQYFKITVQEPVTTVLLETDGGLVEIKVEVSNKRAKRVLTNMRAFVEKCYNEGVYPVDLQGVKAMRVGNVLVLNGDDLKERYPEVDFEKMDELTKQRLVKLQEEFNLQKHMPVKNVDFALYDWNPKFSGDARVVFPHNIRANHIEPACGTGTVAVGIAMLAKGEIKGEEIRIQFESGKGPAIGGPELSYLELKCKEGKVKEAYFSHNRIELTAMGRAWLSG